MWVKQKAYRINSLKIRGFVVRGTIPGANFQRFIVLPALPVVQTGSRSGTRVGSRGGTDGDHEIHLRVRRKLLSAFEGILDAKGACYFLGRRALATGNGHDHGERMLWMNREPHELMGIDDLRWVVVPPSPIT